MQVNAPAHVARASVKYVGKLDFQNGWFIVWMLYSPDQKPDVNLLSIKRRVYEVVKNLHSKMNFGKQY